MTRTERIEKRIAAFDRPLIWLALLAVALYLAELFRAVPDVSREQRLVRTPIASPAVLS